MSGSDPDGSYAGVIDEVAGANRTWATDRFPGARPTAPGRRLAVLTCMDSRIDTFAAFGLAVGDAHIVRNAGGLPTEDALRSLVISQRALGTRAIVVVHHTACGMEGLDDEAFRGRLEEETGAAPPWKVAGFDDVAADTRRTVQVVRDCPWLVATDAVRGFVYDVATGLLTEV